MPAISDPGADLVALCYENSIPVSVIPGPCAAVSALALSGLDTVRFSFEGFLSANKKERIDRLSKVSKDDRTLIFYEAPHKLKTTLKDMQKILGNRRISLVREMTKIHEQVHRTTIDEAVEFYNLNDPRGEYVLVIEGNTESDLQTQTFETDGERLEFAKKLVSDYMESGSKHSEAVKAAAKESGVNRSELYKLTAADSSEK
jgi:16S rRNA (cytidine1402-2'-O)-methyltransferase